MRGSGQRLPITLRFTRVLGTFSHTTCFPFSCALWACFSDRSVSGERSEPIGAPMPHAALWAVQPSPTRFFEISLHCFNAARGFVCGAALHQRQNSRMKSGFNVARGFVGGAANQEEGGELLRVVSMPHAALWVVQPDRFHFPNNRWEVSMPHAALWVVQQRFALSSNVPTWTFQCRTRLCGWCNLRCA